MFSFPSAIPPIPFPLDIGVGVLASLCVLFLFAAAAIVVDASASWRRGRWARVSERKRAVRLPEAERASIPEEPSIAA